MDEVAKLEEEIKVLNTYVPEDLSAEEVDKIINEVMAEIEVSSMKDMGKVVAEVKNRTHGRADMSEVSKKVKELIMKNL